MMGSEKEKENKEKKLEKKKVGLFEFWRYLLETSLRFGCGKVGEFIVTTSKECLPKKEDYYRLESLFYAHRNMFSESLKSLGKALLGNEKNSEIWFQIGQPFFSPFFSFLSLYFAFLR